MTEKRVLLVDDEEGMCRMITAVLGDAGFKVTSFTDGTKALPTVKPGAYDLAVTDVRMPKIGGLDLLERFRAIDPRMPVIIITAHATVETSIQALRRGAYDMLTKPFEPDELIHRVNNALREKALQGENERLKTELAVKPVEGRIIGEAESLLKVLETARKVAARDFPVLITGESGTGKELAAQEIHALSARAGARFVAINCGALPATLLESELFGVKKGAYTGADVEREGLVKAADGGTLFLDEVGTLPLPTQKVFLRFLQEKEFYRVGDNQPVKVDVRILAATNADLSQAVKAGEFREDLYYRLLVAEIKMPPLRERKSDIPLLAAHFLAEQNRRFNTHFKGFDERALLALTAHPWPGNIRQLKNVIEAAASLSSEELVDFDSISRFLKLDGLENVKSEPVDAAKARLDYAASLAKFETAYFADLLERCGGNVEEAAARAGVNLATFYRKMKKYEIRKA